MSVKLKKIVFGKKKRDGLVLPVLNSLDILLLIFLSGVTAPLYVHCVRQRSNFRLNTTPLDFNGFF